MPSRSPSKRRPAVRQIVFPPPPVDPRLILARRWAMWADAELQAGHHAAAEFLSRKAEELREVWA